MDMIQLNSTVHYYLRGGRYFVVMYIDLLDSLLPLWIVNVAPSSLYGVYPTSGMLLKLFCIIYASMDDVSMPLE